MRSALTLSLAVITALVAAAPAAAQEESKTDRGSDFRAPGLTAAERRAMDIRGMTMRSDADGLVIVDVRLAGDLERRIGRGHLRRAYAGIVLRHASGRRTTIATTGPARRAEAAKRGPGEVILVARHGRLLRYVLTGVETPRSVFAATIPRLPRPARRATAAFDPFGMTIIQILSDEEDRKLRERNDGMAMNGIAPGPPTCAGLRRIRAALRSVRLELRVRREQAADPREQQSVQEAINTVDVQLEDVQREIDARCGSAPQGLPEDFSTTYAHGTGRSRICVYVAGTPGAQGDVTVDGTSSPRVQSFTLDAAGRATVFYEIGSHGTYPVGVRWQQPDGSSKVKNGSVTVVEGPGPPPPAGFAACPPP